MALYDHLDPRANAQLVRLSLLWVLKLGELMKLVDWCLHLLLWNWLHSCLLQSSVWLAHVGRQGRFIFYELFLYLDASANFGKPSTSTVNLIFLPILYLCFYAYFKLLIIRRANSHKRICAWKKSLRHILYLFEILFNANDWVIILFNITKYAKCYVLTH